MPQNDCKELRDELNELKTDFNNSQTAVKRALKKVENIYQYEDGLSVDHYTTIIEAMQQAEI